MGKEYTNCYIAFIDILGFKKMIETAPCFEIYEIYAKRMKKPLSRIYLGHELCFDMSDIKMKVMSDSICFYVDSRKPNALIGLIFLCQSFQEQLIQLQEPILTRGAIVKGEIFAENDIIYGPGFVKAYLMEENNAKYPRIIMTKDTIDSAKENTENNMNGLIHQCVFLDFDTFYVVDYWELLEGLDVEDIHCACLLSYINHILDTTTDKSIHDKYLYMRKNLLRWYNPNKRNHDECD